MFSLFIASLIIYILFQNIDQRQGGQKRSCPLPPDRKQLLTYSVTLVVD